MAGTTGDAIADLDRDRALRAEELVDQLERCLIGRVADLVDRHRERATIDWQLVFDRRRRAHELLVWVSELHQSWIQHDCELHRHDDRNPPPGKSGAHSISGNSQIRYCATVDAAPA